MEPGGDVHLLVQTTKGAIDFTLPQRQDAHRVVGVDEWQRVAEDEVVGWRSTDCARIAYGEPPESDRSQDQALRVVLLPERRGSMGGWIDRYDPGVKGSTMYVLPLLPVNWASPNAVGHIVATPVAVACDVVLLPVYGLLLGLVAVGVVHTH